MTENRTISSFGHPASSIRQSYDCPRLRSVLNSVLASPATIACMKATRAGSHAYFLLFESSRRSSISTLALVVAPRHSGVLIVAFRCAWSLRAFADERRVHLRKSGLRKQVEGFVVPVSYDDIVVKHDQWTQRRMDRPSSLFFKSLLSARVSLQQGAGENQLALVRQARSKRTSAAAWCSASRYLAESHCESA